MAQADEVLLLFPGVLYCPPEEESVVFYLGFGVYVVLSLRVLWIAILK